MSAVVGRPNIPLVVRAEQIGDGWTDHELRRRCRSGELVRLVRGTYAYAQDLATLDVEQRYHLLVSTTAVGVTDHVVSHVSAAALWGVPLHEMDLTRVHFTKPGAGGGRVTRVRHDHAALFTPDELAVVGGVTVTSVARTLVDLARSQTAASSVVAVDHALHHHLVTPDDLTGSLDRSAGLPGIGPARRVLSCADGRSESPGESLTRYALRGIPGLESQVSITDARGAFVGRADLGIERALVLIEFDGRRKYLKHRRPGQSVEDAVLEEKKREDAFRALGYLVVRVVWKDLSNVPALVARIERVVQHGLALRSRGMVVMGGYRPRPPIALGGC